MDTETTNPTLAMTTLDCADVRAEAIFWSELLGWATVVVEDEYAMLSGPGGQRLGFGRVDGYVPPTWPDDGGRKQFHLDLSCDDMAAVEERAVGLGARIADPQPGDTWRVLIDPGGHPFCLTAAASWG